MRYSNTTHNATPTELTQTSGWQEIPSRQYKTDRALLRY